MSAKATQFPIDVFAIPIASRAMQALVSGRWRTIKLLFALASVLFVEGKDYMPQARQKSFRNAPCICGSGIKQKRCHWDMIPDSRAGNVLRLYRQIDELLETQNKYASNSLPPCRPGCFLCCYQNFLISGIEFKLVARELKTWSPTQLGELDIICSQRWGILAKEHPEYVLDGWQAEITLKQSVLMEQYSLNCNFHELPCPLLDEEKGICRVYNSRPIICRLHGTTYYIPEEHVVCAKIPSNLDNAKVVVDARSIFSEAISFSKYVINDRTFKSLRYPILYYLNLLFSNYRLTKHILIPNEERDFRLPSHVADRLQATGLSP